MEKEVIVIKLLQDILEQLEKITSNTAEINLRLGVVGRTLADSNRKTISREEPNRFDEPPALD